MAPRMRGRDRGCQRVESRVLPGVKRRGGGRAGALVSQPARLLEHPLSFAVIEPNALTRRVEDGEDAAAARIRVSAATREQPRRMDRVRLHSLAGEKQRAQFGAGRSPSPRMQASS